MVDDCIALVVGVGIVVDDCVALVVGVVDGLDVKV